jgi:uncharacterized protein (UPF0332 family)
MTDVNPALIQYRLERARVTLDEARALVANGFTHGATNRLYYACFYAVNALLHAEGLAAARHSGVRSLFGQHFIRTGRLPSGLGELYNELYEARQETDYDDFVEETPDANALRIAEVADFIEKITALIEAILPPSTL